MQLLRIAGFLLISVSLSACGDNEAKEICGAAVQRLNSEKKATYDRLRNTPLAKVYSQIPDTKAPVITESDYPKTLQQLGPEAFQRSNELVKWAAVYLIEQMSCESLDLVMVSDQAKPKGLVFFGLCEDGEKHYVGETEALAVKRVAAAGGKAQPPPIRLYGARDIDDCIEEYNS